MKSKLSRTSTQQSAMKLFPTKSNWMSMTNDGRLASRRRVGEVELGGNVPEDHVDVQAVDEVPKKSNHRLDVSSGGSTLGRHREGRLVVDEDQDSAASKMLLEEDEGCPDGDDLEGEDLRLSMVQCAMKMLRDEAADPNGGGL